MKTRAEVEELKTAWLKDDVWDIETTEGYEEYKEELILFRKYQTLKYELETEKKYYEVKIKNDENKLTPIIPVIQRHDHY